MQVQEEKKIPDSGTFPKKKKKRNYHDVKPGQTVIVRTVKPFSDRGAYVYLPKTWLHKKVAVRLYGHGGGSGSVSHQFDLTMPCPTKPNHT